jgi:hypothetical protein
VAAAGSSSRKAGAEGAHLLPEDSEDGNNFVSGYEKAHPLVVPKALSQVSCGVVTCLWAVQMTSATGIYARVYTLQHKVTCLLQLLTGTEVQVAHKGTMLCCPLLLLLLLLLLLQDHTLALLKAIGISEGGRGGSRCGGGRLGRRASREAHFSDDGSLSGSTPEAADPPGSLGAKLQELGRLLLQVSFREGVQPEEAEVLRSTGHQ